MCKLRATYVFSSTRVRDNVVMFKFRLNSEIRGVSIPLVNLLSKNHIKRDLTRLLDLFILKYFEMRYSKFILNLQIDIRLLVNNTGWLIIIVILKVKKSMI